VDASLVAGFNEEADVGVHERDGHGDVAAVWKNEFLVIAELLDKTEDVVLGNQYRAIQGLPIDHSSIRRNDLSIRR